MQATNYRRYSSKTKFIIMFFCLVSLSVQAQDNLMTHVASRRWLEWRKQWINSFPTASWSYFQWYGDGSVEGYLTYKDAGLTIVQAPYSEHEVVNHYKNATAVGLKVILGSWEKLYQDHVKLDKFIVAPTSHDTSVVGYMIYDEPHPQQFDSLGRVVKKIYETDKRNAIPFLNLLPNWLVPDDRFKIKYPEFVNQFVTKVDPPFMLSTHYPIFCDGSDNPRYYENAEMFRQISLERNIGLMGFVSLASFRNNVNKAMCYRPASESDIYWQVYSMVAYGAQGIWYFNYRIRRTDKFGDGLVINDTGEPNPIFYPYVRRVNDQLHNLAYILMRLKSVGVYHLHTNSSDLPLNTVQYISGSIPHIDAVEGDNFIISQFKNQDDRKDTAGYVMLVNKRHGMDMVSAKLSSIITFSLGKNFKEVCLYNPDTGEKELLKPINGRYIVNLDGGMGALLRVSS